jgi:hypothetical protein
MPQTKRTAQRKRRSKVVLALGAAGLFDATEVRRTDERKAILDALRGPALETATEGHNSRAGRSRSPQCRGPCRRASAPGGHWQG